MRVAMPQTRRRGFALILVLWGLALLSALAVALSATGRSDVTLTHNLVESSRAAHLADAGVFVGIRALLTPADLPPVDDDGGRRLDVRIDGVDVRLTLRDEGGKVDLNQAPRRLLRGALLAAGAGESDANRLADAVLDWRDRDSRRRDFGAEAPDYERAGRPDRPRNGPFELVSELRLVLGMTDDLFARLRPFVSIDSRQAGLDPGQAPAALLRAVPELSGVDIGRLLDRRRDGAAPGTLPGIGGGAGMLAAGHGLAHTVTADVELPSGVSYRREAVVLIGGAADRPYRIRAWRSPGVDGPVLASP